MITKFNLFNESKEDQMTVTIVISDDYMEIHSKNKFLKDNAQYIKKYLGSYFSSIEAIIDPKDFDTIAELDGVIDLFENDDPMEEQKPPVPRPKESPKTPGGITIGIGSDGKFHTNLDDDDDEPGKTKVYGVGPGGSIGKLGSMNSDELGDWIKGMAAGAGSEEDEDEDENDDKSDDWFEANEDKDFYCKYCKKHFDMYNIEHNEKGTKIWCLECDNDITKDNLPLLGTNNNNIEPEDDMKLESITCVCGGKGEFMINGHEWETVHVGKKHNVIHSYDDNIKNFKDLKVAIQKSQKEDPGSGGLTILGYCNDCEDESTLDYKFDNGYKTSDDEKAFIYTYPELFK